MSLVKNIPFVNRSFILRKIILLLDERKDNKSIEMKYKNFIIANELFIRSKQLLLQKYPNIKFIILTYDYDYYGVIDNYDENGLEMPYMWDILEKEGFIIIHSKDILGRYFHKEDTCSDNYHPSSNAWDLLIPKLAEKLNL